MRDLDLSRNQVNPGEICRGWEYLASSGDLATSVRWAYMNTKQGCEMRSSELQICSCSRMLLKTSCLNLTCTLSGISWTICLSPLPDKTGSLGASLQFPWLHSLASPEKRPYISSAFGLDKVRNGCVLVRLLFLTPHVLPSKLTARPSSSGFPMLFWPLYYAALVCGMLYWHHDSLSSLYGLCYDLCFPENGRR